MNDVLKMGKKVLTIVAVVATILWSVGAPLVASAETTVTLNAGDVIRGASTKNVFVYAADGKRYTFPTDKVFFSWYKDWSMVKVVPDAQLGTIAIGGTVPYRAGTNLVKIATDPKVYAVEPGGSLRWVETGDIAKALWGANWAKAVHDVDPSIFPYVYKISATSVNTASYPVGALVKMGSDYYLIGAGMTKMKVTADGLTANRLQTKFAATATDLSAYASGADLTAVNTSLTTVVGSSVAPGTPGTPAVPAGSGLSVALASDTPAGVTVVSDSGTNGAQAQISVLKLNLTASNDGDVKVTALKLKRSGISADTDISNMYLYDGATLLASNPSVATNFISFNASFTVSKGTTKTLVVKLDLKNAVSAGKTINFAVNDATGVTLSSGAVSGTFPVLGNTFTTAAVTDLGKLVFTNVTPAAAGTVDPGQTGFEIWRFSAANTNQDTEVSKLNFTVVGSVNVGDLTNFSLWDGATQIGSTVAAMNSDKTVTFDLSATPYVVTKGQTKNISLKVDIVSGTTRTFRASLQNAADVLTFDKGYNVFLKTNGTDTFTVVQPVTGTTAVDYTINSGTLTQSLAADSPTGNIADGATNVVLAKFNWKANGEDMKIANLSVSSTCTTCTQSTDANAAASPSGDYLSNVRLLVDGSQVGTTITNLRTDGTAVTAWGSFGNSFIIKAGKSAEVKIVGDTTASAIAGAEVFTVGLVAGSSNAQGVVSLSQSSTNAKNANTLTIQTGTVTNSKNPSFGDKTSSSPTGPVNATQTKVASFVITAGAGESIDVSQVGLTETASTCIGTYLQNLTLKDSTGKQLGVTYSNPSTSCATANTYTFNISPAVNIATGAQYVVDVYADLKASLTTATALIKLDSVTATGHTTGSSASATSQALSLQNMYISSAGAFMVQVDSDTPVANNYLMGAVDQTLAKYKITASSTEAINITQFVVSANVSSGATGTFQNIRLFDNDTGAQVGTAVAAFNSNSTTATTTFAHAIFTNLSLVIPKGVSKVLLVKADAATYDALGVSTTGQTVAPVVMSSYYGTSGNSPVTATGASSGSAVTASVSASGAINIFASQIEAAAATSTLYRAKLTTAWATDTPSGAASPSAAQVVGKFVVTNLANAGAYTATVNYVNFNLSTTISQAAGGSASTRALTVYKDSLSTTAVATTNYSLTNTGADFVNSAFTSWTSTVDVASGASKTFYVTLDTTDAATTKSLSIRIPSAGVNWTDGISSSLTVMSQDLPTVWKTFTY